ncbi:MAG: hypothetical protein QOI48_2995 [Solirubrobacteraceae bacterium]|jgi:hypothetical protein|nr:hypothetical protein [Solirubrobacteraceae bacterium]
MRACNVGDADDLTGADESACYEDAGVVGCAACVTGRGVLKDPGRKVATLERVCCGLKDAALGRDAADVEVGASVACNQLASGAGKEAVDVFVDNRGGALGVFGKLWNDICFG